MTMTKIRGVHVHMTPCISGQTQNALAVAEQAHSIALSMQLEHNDSV